MEKKYLIIGTEIDLYTSLERITAAIGLKIGELVDMKQIRIVPKENQFDVFVDFERFKIE